MISFHTQDDSSILSWSQVLHLWQSDEAFRLFYSNILRKAPYEAFYWEHPPITSDTLEEPYSFVLVKSTSLEKVHPEPKTFKEYYHRDQLVAHFQNLRGDATLISPAPHSDLSYAHFGRFIRTAPEEQIHAFWIAVSETTSQVMSNQPKWLSTAGNGVYWLHVRLDSWPKYYRYTPFREKK